MRPSHWGVLSNQKLSEVWVKSCVLCEYEYCRACRKYRFKLNTGDKYGACKDFRIKNKYAPRIIQIQNPQRDEPLVNIIPEQWQIW